MKRPLIIAAGLGALVTALGATASANERHFTYTYETAVLAPGAREVEIWSTPRLGRLDYYARFDHRLEIEVGLTDRLLTAFYLNASAATFDEPDGRVTESEFKGVSSEWKYKLLDPAADPIGLAVYGELTGETDAFEAEAKLLVDKKIGNVLVASNLVLANEWEFERPDMMEEEVSRAQEVELDLAGTYFLRPGLAVGLEARNHNEVKGGELEFSALFAGPVVAFAADRWWAALSLMPQLPALKTEGDTARELTEHEKFEARLLVSFGI